MEEERFNYIVLDHLGILSYGTDDKITWNIPPYYFSEYIPGDDIHIEFIKTNFAGIMTDVLPTGLTNAIIYIDGVNVQNQHNTDIGNKILDIIPCQSVNEAVSTAHYIIPIGNNNTSGMKLKVDKFNKISLWVVCVGEVLDLYQTVQAPFSFILKVSYNKKN